MINDGARAYVGAVPAPLLREPYMPADELRDELAAGVVFWGCDEGQGLVGVMGLQQVQHVTLIRHAYVRTDRQRRGIGGRLLAQLCARTALPVLVGTWAAAT